MEIFDLNNSNIYPFEERDKNVLFQSGAFKVRLIQLEAGGEIPPCRMATDVIFCVLQGKGIITVNGKTNQVKPHSLIITNPATISMRSKDGMKLLGIQITTKSS
jgi:mannose-6-phosphate isomerase-like protein (cupin superfamily)